MSLVYENLSGGREALCRQYCNKVKRALPLSSRLRSHVLDQLEESVSLFLEENPDSDLEAICAYFGAPENFADNLLENLDGRQLASQMRCLAWKRVAAWLVLGLFLLYGIFYTARLTINWVFQPGYAVVGEAHELEGSIPESPDIQSK